MIGCATQSKKPPPQLRVKTHLMKSAYSLNWESNLMRYLIHYPVFFSTPLPQLSAPVFICSAFPCSSVPRETVLLYSWLTSRTHVSQALMFLINNVLLTHTDISCSRHHNCSFSKPFLNKCREICLQLPNTTTSSEIHGRFGISVEALGGLLNGSILSAQNCPELKELLRVL